MLHEFPPWELHEVPGPYLVTASISDDDTGGAAWGPAGALMYVLDIDNDANNNGLIEPADDPIEEVLPGKNFLANMDDDNDDGIPDYDETGPVNGENNLVEFKLKFDPPIRSDVNSYIDWQVTLGVVPGKGADRIWENPDKSGTQVTLPKVWTVGTDAIPPSLYLESGPRGGEMWLQLRLTPPANPTLVVDTDQVVFFAPPAIDLDTDSDNTHVIEHSELEEKDEADHGGILNIPGKIVLKNTDDDNGNGVQDRADPFPFVDGALNPVMDNDLVAITLALGRPAAEIPGYTVTLVPSGPELRIWKTQDKFWTDLSWAVEDMPAELWVEGYDYGQPTLNVELKNPAGAVVATDEVKFSVVSVLAQAYRPYTTPFVLRPVPFQEEQEIGVGIRRNGDDDDGNGVPDRTHDPVLGEDDLIRVDLRVGAEALPSGVEGKVSRSSKDLNVWDTENKLDGLLTPTSDDLEDVAVPASEISVYAEWVSTGNGSSTFEFSVWDSLHNTKAYFYDIVFSPFNSIVIVLGGETQVPADPVQFPGEHGTFDFAIDEYANGPYDVHMYSEDDVDAYGIGATYNEVVSAIQTRGVTDVAIMGYSHGGGSTYSLAWRMQQNTVQGSGITDITKAFSIPFTGYIDAIDNLPWATTPETRRPPLSLFHCAQWQTNSLILNGANSGGNDDIDRSYLGVDHDNIEDHSEVIDLLHERLHQNVMRR